MLIVMRRTEDGDGIEGFAKCLKNMVIALVKPKDLITKRRGFLRLCY